MSLEWIVGYNMPGYMPESEPNDYDEWEDAREALISELEYTRDNFEVGEELETDIDAAIVRIRSLTEGMPFGETVGAYHYWLDRATD